MKKYIPTTFILIALVFFSCSNDEQNIPDDNDNNSELYFPPINSDVWETSTLSELGWNEAQLQPLLNYVEEKGTKAFIILKDGKIAIEWYDNETSVNTNLGWNSAAKTLVAFTVGIAQDEGFLNINDSSRDYLGDNWSLMTTEQEQSVTIKHHLSMNTGLDFTTRYILVLS